MSRRQVGKHLGLFLLTFLTTTAAGALEFHPPVDGSPWWWLGLDRAWPLADGLSYSVPLMAILLCHELGHYFAARRHGVEASLPYFIPLPPQVGLGTLGAVISMRQVTRNRTKLIDIGAAGPLAGLVVAVPLVAYGLSLSPVGPLLEAGTLEGNSLLYAALKRLVTGDWLPSATHDVFLHPTARAAWSGLLVTMINLLPIGQLDGGHIATAYYGNDYGRFSRRLHGFLPVAALAVFAWVFRVASREIGGRASAGVAIGVAAGAAIPYLIWFLMIGFIRKASGGIDHPPVDDGALPRSRRVLFWLVVAVFLLIFMPVPMRMTFGPAALVAP